MAVLRFVCAWAALTAATAIAPKSVAATRRRVRVVDFITSPFGSVPECRFMASSLGSEDLDV
jgi:hypothetical protein